MKVTKTLTFELEFLKRIEELSEELDESLSEVMNIVIGKGLENLPDDVSNLSASSTDDAEEGAEEGS